LVPRVPVCEQLAVATPPPTRSKVSGTTVTWIDVLTVVVPSVHEATSV